MDLLKKLEQCEARFKEVSELVQSPDLVKDQKKYKDTMRVNFMMNIKRFFQELKMQKF